MAKENKVDDAIFIAAIRYVLGRQTYMVSEVIDIILNYEGLLSPKTENLILKDINTHEANYGFNSIDKPYWDKLKDCLEKRKEDREIDNSCQCQCHHISVKSCGCDCIHFN